ncbi:MAG: phage integrase SAM-like domain-containing protein [Cyclobacteriaceae bacterium]
MNFPSITVVFNRLNYKSKNGLSPIHLRFSYNGKSDYIKINKIPKITERDWIGNAYHGLWVKNNPLANNLINELLTDTRNFVQKEIFESRPVSVKSLKAHIQKPEHKTSFNEYAAQYVRNINKNKSDDEKRAYRTIQAYRSFLVKINSFEDCILFENINRELLTNFKDYLAGECNLKKTTRSKYFDKFKVIYEDACTHKFADYLPGLFKGFMAKGESEQVYLTMEEIKAWKNCVLDNEVLDKSRDIFLISVFTGLNYSDLKRLSKEHLEAIVNNEGKAKEYLTNRRFKGRNKEGWVPFVVPLSTMAKKLLEKRSNMYDDDFPNDIPAMIDLTSDSKYNDKLKLIAKEAGINKNISAKIGRNSYGRLMITIGNEMPKVSKSMGHKKLSTTEIYTTLDPSMTMYGWKEPEF